MCGCGATFLDSNTLYSYVCFLLFTTSLHPITATLPLFCTLAKRHCVVPGAARAAAARGGIALPDARPSQARRRAAAMPTLAAGAQVALAALPSRARPEMAAGAAAGLLRHVFVFLLACAAVCFCRSCCCRCSCSCSRCRCCSAAAAFAATAAAAGLSPLQEGEVVEKISKGCVA